MIWHDVSIAVFVINAIAKNKRFVKLAKQKCVHPPSLFLSLSLSLSLFSRFYLVPCHQDIQLWVLAAPSRLTFNRSIWKIYIRCLKAELRPAVVGKDQKATIIFAQCSPGKESIISLVTYFGTGRQKKTDRHYETTAKESRGALMRKFRASES